MGVPVESVHSRVFVLLWTKACPLCGSEETVTMPLEVVGSTRQLNMC